MTEGSCFFKELRYADSPNRGHHAKRRGKGRRKAEGTEKLRPAENKAGLGPERQGRGFWQNRRVSVPKKASAWERGDTPSGKRESLGEGANVVG